MKKCTVFFASLALVFTACAAAPSDNAAATPAPTVMPAPTAASTSEATAVLVSTPVPTMVGYDEISFDDWRNGEGCRMPDYTFSAPHKPLPDEKVAWPTEGVPLCYNAQTLEEAAERFNTTVENLKALNPGCEDAYARDGMYYHLKIQAEPYTVPLNNVVTVKVRVPWLTWYDRSGNYEVPAGLNRQAQAALATAYFFEERYYGLHAGFMEWQSVDDGFWGTPEEGEIYTSFSEFSTFLHRVYSEKRFRVLADSADAPFKEGENDTILSINGDRGSNIADCGYLFTKPELQQDGSLTFYQIELTCESENFHGWDVTEPVVPDTATLLPVRMIPTEDGWRVDTFGLPY